jgi:hypothetical protein
MEYYHYVNIFETKGLEYILVILFMITFVFFVRNLNRPAKGVGNGARGRKPDLGETLVVVDESKGDTNAS